MPGHAHEQIPPSTVADLKAAIAILSRETEVRRVWLFGSLAKGREPDFRSDVDLPLVAPLPAMDPVTLTGARVERLCRLVDVVVLERCRFRAKILREGEEWTV